MPSVLPCNWRRSLRARCARCVRRSSRHTRRWGCTPCRPDVRVPSLDDPRLSQYPPELRRVRYAHTRTHAHTHTRTRARTRTHARARTHHTAARTQVSVTNLTPRYSRKSGGGTLTITGQNFGIQTKSAPIVKVDGARPPLVLSTHQYPLILSTRQYAAAYGSCDCLPVPSRPKVGTRLTNRTVPLSLLSV